MSRAQVDLVALTECSAEGCKVLIRQKPGKGRPRRSCSDNCRKALSRARRKLQEAAQVAEGVQRGS